MGLGLRVYGLSFQGGQRFGAWDWGFNVEGFG